MNLVDDGYGDGSGCGSGGGGGGGGDYSTYYVSIYDVSASNDQCCRTAVAHSAAVVRRTSRVTFLLVFVVN